MTTKTTTALVAALLVGIGIALVLLRRARKVKSQERSQMGLSELIRREIANANKCGDQVEDLVIARGQCPTGDRNTLLMAHWSLAFDLHRGILSCLSNQFYGSAFALVRSIVEAAVRAHLVIMGSNDDLEKLKNDQYKTNFATIGKEVDARFGTGNLFENFLGQGRLAMHSYTHSGLLQLSRRFSGTDLLPNYEDDEIVEVIGVSTSAVFLATNLVTKHLGFDDEWKRCTELYAKWGDGRIKP